jgi:hypothetical protein
MFLGLNYYCVIRKERLVSSDKGRMGLENEELGHADRPPTLCLTFLAALCYGSTVLLCTAAAAWTTNYKKDQDSFLRMMSIVANLILEACSYFCTCFVMREGSYLAAPRLRALCLLIIKLRG